MELLMARLQSRFPRLSLAVLGVFAIAGAGSIHKMAVTGQFRSRGIAVDFADDPVIFAFFLAALLIFEAAVVGYLILWIWPERNLQRLSPKLYALRSARKQWLKARLERLNADDVEHRAFDDPPRFVIPPQRGVHVSGIHVLGDTPSGSKSDRSH